MADDAGAHSHSACLFSWERPFQEICMSPRKNMYAPEAYGSHTRMFVDISFLFFNQHFSWQHIATN